MLCVMHCSQISITSRLIVLEWRAPIWFKHATALVLSIRTVIDVLILYLRSILTVGELPLSPGS